MATSISGWATSLLVEPVALFRPEDNIHGNRTLDTTGGQRAMPPSKTTPTTHPHSPITDHRDNPLAAVVPRSNQKLDIAGELNCAPEGAEDRHHDKDHAHTGVPAESLTQTLKHLNILPAASR